MSKCCLHHVFFKYYKKFVSPQFLFTIQVVHICLILYQTAWEPNFVRQTVNNTTEFEDQIFHYNYTKILSDKKNNEVIRLDFLLHNTIGKLTTHCIMKVTLSELFPLIWQSRKNQCRTILSAISKSKLDSDFFGNIVPFFFFYTGRS